MAILKKFTQAFTQTPNDILNRNDLSLKAKGMWTYLNSKPEGWTFSVQGIKSQNQDGKESVTSGLKELENKRYLKRVPNQENDGRFNGYNYILFDQPFLIETDSETTVVGKSVNGEHSNVSNNIKSKKELSKKDEETLFSVDPISKDILKKLNELKPSKIDFKPTAGNLKNIESRIKEGFKMEDFEKVIQYKVNEWKHNDKMKQYIRPETLFGSKFNGYLVESESGNSSNDGSQNFKFNQTTKAELL